MTRSLTSATRRWLSQPATHRAFTVAALFFTVGAFCLLATACAVPTWIGDANRILPILVDSVLALISAIAAFSGNPEISGAVEAMRAIALRVEAALRDLNTLVEQYKSNPNASLLQKIEDVANLIAGDLRQLLGDFGIPANLAAPIAAAVQLILAQLEAWITLLPMAKVNQPAGTQLTLTVPMAAGDFKKAFNSALNVSTGAKAVDAALAITPRLH